MSTTLIWLDFGLDPVSVAKVRVIICYRSYMKKMLCKINQLITPREFKWHLEEKAFRFGILQAKTWNCWLSVRFNFMKSHNFNSDIFWT